MRGSSGRSDRLLQGLLLWTALTTMVFWLPFVRGLFDGVSYQWGGFGFSGRGTAGDYWFVATASVLAIALQYLAWRGPRAPFYALFGGWHLYLLFTTASAAISDPASLRFQGDTLGVDVSFAVAAPIIMGVAAALALLWIVRDARNATPRPPWTAWTPRNTRWVLALAALLPMQLVLLRVGEPHGTTDQIGVLVTIAQWFALSIALAVRPRPDPQVKSVGRALA
jgi:hypothetical protein